MTTSPNRGFTLVELIVSVGLFAIIMLLVSGAYIVMISLNRQAQAVSSGADNLAFAIENMNRTILTGTSYNCAGVGDCLAGGTSFSVKDKSDAIVTFGRSTVNGKGVITRDGGAMTDSSTVNVTALTFYVSGTATAQSTEYTQPRVRIVVKGTVVTGPGKTQSFSLESGATMRGSDLGIVAPPPTGNSTYVADGTFHVPNGVTSITVKAWGAGGGGGGGGSSTGGGAGGGGGFAQATLAVSEGEDLAVYVGGGGGGGGAVSTSYGAGGGGGGFSGIFRGATELLIAAGGGGGGGGDNTGASSAGGAGGAGGGASGLAGVNNGGPYPGFGGGGGTNSLGGTGGSVSGANGVAQQGGVGGSSLGATSGNPGTAGTHGGSVGGYINTSNGRGGGGGGGGGHMGGGGGGAPSNSDSGGGGGGGGSSAASVSATLTSGSGTVPGNPSDPNYAGAAGQGGAGGLPTTAAVGPGTAGNPGRVYIYY